MREDETRDDELDLSRRTFVKGAGAVAGAGLLGASPAGATGSSGEIDGRLLNWRNVEAAKVWDRGYRGRPDRSLALTDSGISVRHPDLGPWNGKGVVVEDGEFTLIDAETSDRTAVELGGTIEDFRTGTAGPGTFATGNEVATESFVPQNVVDDREDVSGTPVLLDALLYWDPYQDNTNDLELRLDVQTDGGGWEPVATAATADMPEQLLKIDVAPEATYRFVAEQYTTAQCSFRIDLQFYEYEGQYASADDPFAFLDGDSGDGPMPKTVGWYDPGGRYGLHDAPRDPNGHGSHCSGIMAGTGRASTIDYDNTTVKEPRTVLLPTDFVEYEVDVHATASVFVSALGENVVVEIVHDDEVVHESPLRMDSIVADEPAVHDSGTETYTVRVRPMETRAAAPAAQQAQSGNPTTGRLNRIALGSYLPPANVTEGARSADGPQAVHPGLAPNSSLVGLQGLSQPTADLGEYAEEFAETFNIRAVNMSWGYAYGLPFGAFGGQLSDLPGALKQIADAGMLTVAAAGNFMTPANGNGVPGGMDEPISVAATGPFDGLTPYSAGGLGSVDEDESDVDRKPDVTAPGGDIDDFLALLATGAAGTPYPIPSYYELVRSVRAADPKETFEDGDPPRDYASFGGTSMASPYVCGTAGLVAQAMEEDAPADVELPAPAEADFDDAMRLKQVILSTASETVFTAAPYHAAKTPPHHPTYEFGGRDPYEGYGRVNPDAAVDAVSRSLVDPSAVEPGGTKTFTSQEDVGLYIPEDSRAVAGYVEAEDGSSFTATVSFTGYSGGNRGMAGGAPHIDLFVYDAAVPAANGEPNIVGRAQGRQGDASVSVDVSTGDGSRKTYYVVAKLVNVPGVVNGFDVQANVDLGVSYTAPALPAFTASGSRSNDGTVKFGGYSHRVELTLSGIEGLADDTAIRVTDTLPSGDWSVDTEHGDAMSVDGTTVVVDETTVGQVDGSYTYFAEAPEGAANSNVYTFGPGTVELQNPKEVTDVRNDSADFTGTSDVVVAGVSTDPNSATPSGSGSSVSSDGGTASGGTDSDVGSTVEDASDSLL